MLTKHERNIEIHFLSPSPAGEGWGEESKIKTLSIPPHPTFSLWRRL